MRAWLAALLFAFALPAAAADLPQADTTAIRAVVQGQLDAFRRDDQEAAFGFASPTIQDVFRTPEGFMAMVRQGYAPVYRPRQVLFQDIVTFRGQPTQRVYLVGPDGRAVIAYYLMERQPDGTWRIDGCILEPVADAQA
jgi:hypothetical protein